MKKKMFKVSFKKGDPVEVYTFTKSQAKILAQEEVNLENLLQDAQKMTIGQLASRYRIHKSTVNL